MITSLNGLALFWLDQIPVHAQDTGVIITVTNVDGVNVRGGPSVITYPVLGHLDPGATAKALGVSPGREWIQIEYPGAPNGVGWVYASFVDVSSGNLQIIEPPPTPAPRVTATIDPTLAAQFFLQPTVTRVPTFTPPPPLTVPQFADTSLPRRDNFPFGAFISGLGLIGITGLLVSFLLRRQ